MNRRIIQKIMADKHQKLCDSIADDSVRNLVKKNAMITGGSIVSLLLREPVSDFDFYFRDIETVGEGQDYVESLTNALSDQTVSEQGDNDKHSYRPVFLSDNAITLSDKCQLVIRFYGDPEEVHENYDFVHCTNYWTAWDKTLVLRPAAMESMLARELYYVGSLYPLCSVIRTRKFLKRGWHINAGQYLKMCFQISKLDLSDIGVLQEQLTGVDAAYFVEIINYCKARKEQEPDFKVTMPYLCAIVDRIFGGCEE